MEIADIDASSREIARPQTWQIIGRRGSYVFAARILARCRERVKR
jgi:hypothetical protein